MAAAIVSILASPAARSAQTSKPGSKVAQLENYKDLITKAQNLTLQRDRLQTSQVLIRAILGEKEKDPKGAGVAAKELVRALDELTTVFYTEKAQSLVATGDSLVDAKPKEAIEQYQEALRVEDGNVATLKALARAQIKTLDCDRAETTVKSAESMNPFSAEIKLLRLQALACRKDFDGLETKLSSADPDLIPVEIYMRGLQISDAIRKKDLKKARSILSSWETQAPDYPEVQYWKWELSKTTGAVDRVAAVKYSQLCQNLTSRKRKNHALDVDLCRSKDLVDAYLKESGFQRTTPPDEETEE